VIQFNTIRWKNLLSTGNAWTEVNLSDTKATLIIGDNGAGKSTISNVLMGNPKYIVKTGKILLNGFNITNLPTDERAKLGLFMSFQHPAEISGVSLFNFLRISYNSLKKENLNVGDFRKLLNEKLELLKMDKKLTSRFVNFGFSGGEKKRSEILQLLMFEPKYAILDEIDSGLDVDALKIIINAINKIKEEKKVGFFIITHYDKILDEIKPDKVYVLKNGKIENIGDYSLAKKTLDKGFN